VEEVARFFQAIPSLKHRTILMLAYGAGLRIGEAVRVDNGPRFGIDVGLIVGINDA
jgi:integrase